jgi:hypothetical protein
MKGPQFLMIVLIALAAVAGATVATVTHLNSREPAPVVENLAERPLFKTHNNRVISTLKTPAEISPEPKQASRDFSKFRERLLEAIKRRDANFIRAIVTPHTQWSWGGSLNIESHKIDDPLATFWQYLEKSTTAGCTLDPDKNVAEKDPDTEVWVCPDTSGKVIYNFGWQQQVAILKDRVNVRSQPGTSSDIVGVISKELVQFDSQAYNKLPQEMQENVNSPEGWTPIIINDNKQGWVQNRFVYYEPRDYRVSFVQSRGQWRLRYFLRGDGN